MFELDEITPPENDNTPANRIRILKNEGMLPRDIGDILYALRTKRNLAVHEGHDSLEDCKTLLHLAHTLCVWFMQTYGDYTYEPAGFKLPEDFRNQSGYHKLIEDNEKLLKELEKVKAEALSNVNETPVQITE